jgi:hypothetical protein
MMRPSCWWASRSETLAAAAALPPAWLAQTFTHTQTRPVPIMNISQLVRKLGGAAEPFEGLKLHREAACFTAHPLWQQLSSPHCSFEEACSLLAGGAAEELLTAPPGCRGSRQKRAAAEAAKGGPAQEPRSKQQRHALSCARCGAGAHNGTPQPPGQQGLCMACSRVAPGQPAAAAPAAQLGSSGSGSGGTAAAPDPGAQAPAGGQKYQKYRQTSWSGLEPTDCGVYCIRLPPSVAVGKCGMVSAPGAPRQPWVMRSAGYQQLVVHDLLDKQCGAQRSSFCAAAASPCLHAARYARAVFSGSASSMDPPATVTLVLASDGRQFRCGLACKPHGCSLSGLRPVLQALGVAAGSQLRFVPAGLGAATVSLQTAGSEADAAASSRDAAGAAAAAEVLEAGTTQAVAPRPEAGKTSEQRALKQLFGSDSE